MGTVHKYKLDMLHRFKNMLWEWCEYHEGKGVVPHKLLTTSLAEWYRQNKIFIKDNA